MSISVNRQYEIKDFQIERTKHFLISTVSIIKEANLNCSSGGLGGGYVLVCTQLMCVLSVMCTDA